MGQSCLTNALAVEGVPEPHKLQLGNFTKCYQRLTIIILCNPQAKETHGEGGEERSLRRAENGSDRECRIIKKSIKDKTARSPGLWKQTRSKPSRERACYPSILCTYNTILSARPDSKVHPETPSDRGGGWNLETRT